MGVVHSQDSGYAEEMRKWESQHTQYGPPGRPYTYQPFPTRMYKAGRNAHGKIVILDAQTAGDEDEQRNLESRGFMVGGQAAAIEACEQQELEIAKLAAERNYEIAHGKHSEGAIAEVRAAEAAAGARHLAEIPETPIKKRGRKPKTADAVSA